MLGLWGRLGGSEEDVVEVVGADVVVELPGAVEEGRPITVLE